MKPKITSPSLNIGILKCDTWHPSVSTKWGDIDAQYKHLINLTAHKKQVPVNYHTFECESGQFPSKSQQHQMDSFDGFVITGSRFSSYDKKQWIYDLLEEIRILNNKKKKTFGFCFGHQAIGDALGGKVEKVGWNLSHEVIQVDEKFGKEHNLPKQFGVLCIHQDQVTKVPPGFNVWSWNEFCPVQGLIHKEGHIMTTQAHPEFRPQVLTDLLQTKRGIIKPESLIEDAIKRINGPIDTEVLSQLVFSFFVEQNKPSQ